MSNINELEMIVRRTMTAGLWDMNPKMGWINGFVFDGIQHDPHNVLIKLGGCMEKIIKETARLRYPSEQMPNLLPGHGVSKEEFELLLSSKFKENKTLAKPNAIGIVTKLNKAALHSSLTSQCDKFFPDKRANKTKELKTKITQDEVLGISEFVYKNVPLQNDPWIDWIDLCPLINGVFNVIEVKLTGDTDAGKTQNTIVKNMISPYCSLGDVPKKLYYGIVSSNKDAGTGGVQMNGYMSKDMILIEEDFFRLILPDGVSFEDFKRIVKARSDMLKNMSRRK